MESDPQDVAALGRVIIRRREGLQWTTYRLAQRAGVPDPFLRRIEEGKPKTVGVGTVARLARALGTTTDALLIESGLMDAPADWQAGRQPLDVYLRETSPLTSDDIRAVTHLVQRLSESAAPYDADEPPSVHNLAAHPVDEEAREQRRIAEGWTDEEAP